MPQLTVLMPVYNAQKYLAEAIDSILQQSFTDFEFLIIDDASTDGSVEIVKSYTDPRIRLVLNEINLGISATLNKGIALSASEFIARMDADDISYPDRLSKQIAYMQAHPECAMVSSLVRVISEDGQFVRQDKFESDYFYYNLTFICWIYHPTVMYRKQAVTEVGMYAVPYAEDFELFWQLSRKFVIYNLPEVLLDYRVTNQSLHQVLKKQEYEQAQQEQLLRNFRYYAGPDYTIPASFVECLQHNFQPLLAEQSVSSVLNCIRELDKLTSAIQARENVNRDTSAIEQAAKYKRRFILDYFARNLPRFKGTLLLLRAGYFKLLYHVVKARLLRVV
ncbi:glycosyltransferase [Pontibacter diazotrophicus]|uniref:Glycosyltransferase n=1 Tax=Pontibacter diazotrophicus TaxID=1400979 RepID=A0A3D8LH65_9BACT|nr:glycosyltransferase [Pontibacter diazotrophicus]RDV16708.1 glycosyltransferase [Pontibacter diazotrophicus]